MGNCIWTWTLGSPHTTQTVPGLSGRKLTAQVDCFCDLSIMSVHTQALRLDPTLVVTFVYTRNMCTKVDTCAPAHVTVSALQHGWEWRHMHEYTCVLCTHMHVSKGHGICAYVNVLTGVRPGCLCTQPSSLSAEPSQVCVLPHQPLRGCCKELSNRLQ